MSLIMILSRNVSLSAPFSKTLELKSHMWHNLTAGGGTAEHEEEEEEEVEVLAVMPEL